MRAHRGRDRGPILGTGAATAGWIFADMLLVLMIVGLGVQVTKADVPEPPVQPVEKKKPPVMSPKAVKRSIHFNADALLSSSGAARAKQLGAITDKVQRATKDLRGRRAAMVLVWGSAPEVGRGSAIAEAVSKRLPRADRKLFADVVPRPLWTGGPEGTVEMEIYVFS